MSIRVVIADDQALVRAGFRMILDSQADITVTGEAANGQEAIQLSREQAPDVVLMDIRMPVLDGLAATRAILKSGPLAVRVVILTTYDLDEYVYRALQAGASGFLLKDVKPERLVRGVRDVVAGEALLGPSVTRRLISLFVAGGQPAPAEPSPLPASLTAREADVLRLIATGGSNAEIARQLSISENTVKTHITHILDKLQLRDRVQAVILAYQAGIVR
jgi:DNA-binding NarL/FixJ family response regulator